MDSKIFQDYSEKERIEMLEANADKVEEMDYTVALSKEVMDEKKDLLALAAIAISRLECELKEIKKQYKEKLKPLNQEKETLLEEIKHKSVSVFGKCYKLIDGNVVGYYSPQGELVMSRPARPEERQGTIMQLQRTAVNE